MSYQMPLVAVLPATAAAVLICLAACKREEPADVESATPPVEAPVDTNNAAGSGTITPGTTTTPAETPVDAGVAPAAPQYDASRDSNSPGSGGTGQ